MENQFTIKRLLVGIVVFALGLMTLLTLSIPLLKVDYPILSVMSIYESGFTLLDLESTVGIDNEMAIACGVFSLVQLLLSIAAMIFAVVCIFMFNKSTTKKIMRGFAISCFVFIVFYMAWGFAFIGIYRYWHSPVYTRAYIGFIVGAILFTAYIICTKKLKDDTSQNKKTAKTSDVDSEVTNTATNNAAKQHPNNITQASIIAEALKQYKELLDCGIITQEEFDKKKREILG